MSATPNRRSLPETTAPPGFDPIIVTFIDDLRRQGEIAEGQFPKYRYAARHFLIWLEHSGIALETVDGTVIDRFLQHDCRCAASSGARPAPALAQASHLVQTHDVHPLP